MRQRIWNLIFSRYFVCALVIMLEVLMMAFVIAAASIVSYLFLALTVIVDFITVIAIINRDANPEYKVTWTIVVVALPLLGTLLYVIFYRRRVTKKEELLLKESFTKIRSLRGSNHAFDMMRRRSPLAAGKARAIINDDPLAEVYCQSSSVFFPSGEEYFRVMVSELK